MDENVELVPVPRGDLIAISRLLWDIGAQNGTSHQHRVDCYGWGARLDDRVGLPPWPTPGEPTEKVVQFYEGIRDHLDGIVDRLKRGEPE